MPPKKSSIGRIHELDLLRGYFIFVIIVDHIQRWPSALTYVTGEGRLWVSAAEGFFIISGLLIGYLRGRKALDRPFKDVATLLVKRAALLYVWSVIITFIAIALVALLANDSRLALLPQMPASTGIELVWSVLSQQYVFSWIYFLRLYWIMLLVAPLAILLLRRRKWWVVPLISIGIYVGNIYLGIPEEALQWQVLFFVPAAIGFHLETIVTFLRRHLFTKTVLLAVLTISTLITMALSYFWVLGWKHVEGEGVRMSRDMYIQTREWLDPIFQRTPMAPARIALAFLWFGGLLSIFHLALPYIRKLFGWLLLPFGQFSLTAYCIHAIALLFIQFWIPTSESKLFNLLIGIGGVLMVWGLLKVPYVRKVLPQ